MFQIKSSYYQPTSSTSFIAEIDYINDKSNECFDNKPDKYFNNKPDEYLKNRFDEQSDNEFDEQVELYEGQIFQIVEKAYSVVEAFANSNRFGIRKRHVEKDPNNNVHTGYTPDPSTIKFILKNRKLTDKMLADIKYYMIVEKLNASTQY
ncbi:20008_t:CDS:2 [Cetraspora pellucida]|uniref:20008_t:CDS:1 n=1 Tax=Cetraspora pellucida TaxID=1433469 RepID=A0A9N9NBF2_9GLOM|nr:20008_t:CDS:2 [Cetraspora pellucida]